MTTNQRVEAKAEVDAARTALVDYLNQLEDHINIPKRVARATGRCWRRTQEWATENPAAAAAVGAAALAAVAGVITLAVKISRR